MNLASLEASRKGAWINHFDAATKGAVSLAKAYEAQALALTAERDAALIHYRRQVAAAAIPKADARHYHGKYAAAKDSALADLTHDAELKSWALHRADETLRAVNRHLVIGPLTDEQHAEHVMAMSAAARNLWRQWGMTPPDLTPQRTAQGVLARMCDDKQWRAAARKQWAQLREGKAIKAGRVHRRAGLYLSDAVFKHICERRADNRSLLEKMVAVANDGETIALIDAVDASLANPRLRRIDTLDWAGAIDRIAEHRGDVAMFETLTLSSRWHSHKWQQRAVARNAKWDAAGCPMPSDGQARLAELWDKAVRKLRRKKIGWYGMRTVQPHHDGTPHWHVLIFCQPQHVSAIHQTLREFFLKDDPDEPGADERRVVLRMIDRSKGSAVGYVSRYIARAIDGSDCRDLRERDDEGVMRKTANDSITGAQRATAWASVWRIRMFQFFGIPSKLWARELRRVESCDDWLLEKCRAAADEADFAEFIDLVGGPMTKRKQRPLATWRDPSLRKNRFEEPRPDSVKGVQLTFAFFDLPPRLKPRIEAAREHHATESKLAVRELAVWADDGGRQRRQPATKQPSLRKLIKAVRYGWMFDAMDYRRVGRETTKKLRSAE